MENNLVQGKCSRCKGTGRCAGYFSSSELEKCWNCGGTGEQCFDGQLICNCCLEVMGYIGHDCDMNGNDFVCVECRNKGAYVVETKVNYGWKREYKLPE